MKPCIATTRRYDNQAAKEKMTDREKFDILVVVKKQRIQAIRNEPINCAGENCDAASFLLYIYRCWFCGRYYCLKCSRKHFGKR